MKRLTKIDLKAFEQYFDEQVSSVAKRPNTYLTWSGARLLFTLGMEKGFKYYNAKDKLKGKSVQDRVSVIQNLCKKLQEHEHITKDYWLNCFRLFDDSMGNGALSIVTKKE